MRQNSDQFRPIPQPFVEMRSGVGVNWFESLNYERWLSKFLRRLVMGTTGVFPVFFSPCIDIQLSISQLFGDGLTDGRYSV